MSGNDGQTGASDPRDPEYLNKLIAAVARGEDRAFDQVFVQLNGPVYRLALALVRDAAQAEEITQEVLAEIWRLAGRFDPGQSNAMAWALMIARRRSIDRVRSVTADASRERRIAVLSVAWDQVSEAVEDGLDRENLRRNLGRLSDPQRQAIVAVFDEGHTIAEAALILNIPAGTVKSRIRAAVTNLRRSMRTEP
ncbi:MAG TPA: sigma-70 family RNA polymerase sigma factor [Streptosporangiaceae bacterium]